MSAWQVVTTAAELLEAIASGNRKIEVRGTVTGMPMITLSPGVRLRGHATVWGEGPAPDQRQRA